MKSSSVLSRVFVALCFSVGTLWAQNPQPDATFSPVITDGSIAAPFSALQADGKVLADGARVRYNADGSLDASYRAPAYSGYFQKAQAMADGRIVICSLDPSSGAFTFTRYKADGSLDAVLATGLTFVRAFVVQPDGKILFSSSSPITINGTARKGIARLNSDGSLDASFDPGQGPNAGYVTCFAVQPDGKILVGGYFSAFDGATRPYLVRLNATGTVDLSFTAAAASVITLAAVLPGGKITAFESIPNRLIRLNTDGSIDTVSGVVAGGAAEIYALATDATGRVLIGGGFTSFNGLPRANLVRLAADGSLDSTFVAGGIPFEIHEVAAQSDGKVFFNDQTTRLSRLDATGRLDPTFAPGQPRTPARLAAARQADGRIVIAGDFSAVNGVPRASVARLKADGSLDSSFVSNDALVLWVDFGNGAQPAPVRLALQSDGGVLIAGGFIAVGGAARSGIARFGANGVLDPAFAPVFNTGGTASAVAVLPDGRIVVGGSFTSVNNVSCGNIAVFQPSGGLDISATTALMTNGAVKLLGSRADGGVVLGGSFTTVGGLRRNAVAAIDATGALDVSFAPTQISTSESVAALAAAPDGSVFIAGPTALRRARIRHLKATGEMDPDFNFNFEVNATFSALAVDGQNRVIAAYSGAETDPLSHVTTAIPYLQRFDARGNVDGNFNTGTGFSTSPQSLTVASDGMLLAAGDFSAIDDVPCGHVVRLTLDGPSAPAPGILFNLSTRGDTGSGANVLTAGFVIAGTQPKTVLLRATGPALAGFGVPGTIADPGIILVNSIGAVVASNADWKIVATTANPTEPDIGYNAATTAARVGAFPLTSSSEAVLVITLPPGAYSAQVRGTTLASQTGITLVEVYDANVLPGDRSLANISTRANVGTGDHVLIGGLIVTGTTPRTVLIRAVGPTLGQYDVAGTLADPKLELRAADGSTIATNDDWGGGAELANAFVASGAFALPANSKDAAIRVTLQPGRYSTIVSGANGTTGIALVEIYATP